MIKKAKEIDFKIDKDQDSPADYTLKFVGIQKEDSEEEIVKHINSKERNPLKKKRSFLSYFSRTMNNVSNTRNAIRRRRSVFDIKAIKNFSYFEIEKASKAYNVVKFVKELKRLKSMRKKRAKLRVKVNLCKKSGNISKAEFFMKKVLELNFEIKKQKGKILKSRENLNNEGFATGVVFISFKYKHERDEFAMKHESNFWNTWIYTSNNFTYKGNRVKVYDADEPSDVIWENIGHSKKKKACRYLTTYFFSILAISLNFLTIYLIKRRQKDMRISNMSISDITKGNSNSLIYTVSFLISLIIIAINSLNRVIMRYFTKLELHESQTEFNLSYSQKLSRLEFINTCGVVLFTHIQLAVNKRHIWVAGGLVYDASFVLLSYIVNMSIGPFFKYKSWVKSFKRWRFRKLKSGFSSLLQFEANELFTKGEIDLAYCYSKGVSAFLTAAFFTPVIPFSGLVITVALIITYWVQKIRFARLCKRPKEAGAKIALDSIYRLGYAPFILYVNFFNKKI